jgi:2-phosphoglycerate kinase
MNERRTIIIIDKAHGLPFSKGLLGTSLTATGVVPHKAWEIAQKVEAELLANEEYRVRSERIREMALAHLESAAGHQYAERYQRLHEASRHETPLIVLIGGTTGVGKSTIATEVAHRLGINRISSTDSIREVMRGIFCKDLMPAIYESAFSAWRGLRVPAPQGANPVIVGFREQTAAVSTGIKALIRRAALEGMSMVVEGIHLVPGYLDPREFGPVRVVQLVIGVQDEESHLSHFFIREAQTDGNRPHARYRENFSSIRTLGAYIEDLANEHDIPVIYSHQLDKTIAEVVELILARALDTEDTPGGTGADNDIGGQAT